MAALPRTWFLFFPFSSIIEVVVYFHEFHQKPTTLDGDSIVISTVHLMSEQWHVLHVFYFETLDLIVSSIEERFDQPSFKVFSNMESLLMGALSSQDVSSQMDYMKEIMLTM